MHHAHCIHCITITIDDGPCTNGLVIRMMRMMDSSDRGRPQGVSEEGLELHASSSLSSTSSAAAPRAMNEDERIPEAAIVSNDTTKKQHKKRKKPMKGGKTSVGEPKTKGRMSDESKNPALPSFTSRTGDSKGNGAYRNEQQRLTSTTAAASSSTGKGKGNNLSSKIHFQSSDSLANAQVPSHLDYRPPTERARAVLDVRRKQDIVAPIILLIPALIDFVPFVWLADIRIARVYDKQTRL